MDKQRNFCLFNFTKNLKKIVKIIFERSVVLF